jgi:hypothetical protein
MGQRWLSISGEAARGLDYTVQLTGATPAN